MIEQNTDVHLDVQTDVADGGFALRLVSTARSLARDLGQSSSEDELGDRVRHELALTLSQLDRVRSEGARATNIFIELECQVGTELLQMNAERWWYGPERFARWHDREHLRARAGQLALDRIRMESGVAHQVRVLEERLLILVHRHSAVSPTGGGSDGDLNERARRDASSGKGVLSGA